MKVSSSELPPRQVVLEIEVEQERVDRAMDQAFRRIAGRVNVPGFRKGKAPRTLIERTVGRQAVLEDALEHLAPQVVDEAVKQEDLKPYSRPRVELVELQPLKVKATVPLEPKVELGDYKSIAVEKKASEVGDEEVESVVNRLRESYAQWVPAERAIEKGDRVTIDLKGEVVGEERVLLDSKDAEYQADPEGPQPAPGFTDQVIGLEPGAEKEFDLTLDEDYFDEALRGKQVRFTVKVHGLKAKELPEVDDVFAQQVGDYADPASLRSAIESQLKEREASQQREALEQEVLDKLVETSTIEVAPQVVEHQAEHLLESFAQSVQRQGIQFDQYLRLVGKSQEDMAEEVKVEAEKRVRRALALDAFARAEGIQVTPEEIVDEVARAASELPNPQNVQVQALQDPDTIQRVASSIVERRALARLIAMVTGEPEQPESSDAAASSPAESAPQSEEKPDTEETAQQEKSAEARSEE